MAATRASVCARTAMRRCRVAAVPARAGVRGIASAKLDWRDALELNSQLTEDERLIMVR